MSVISDSEIILRTLEELYKAGVRYELKPALSLLKEVDFQKAGHTTKHKVIDGDYVPFMDKCGGISNLDR